MITIKNVVLVGFGNIGQGLLPLLYKQLQVSVIIFEKDVTLVHEEISSEFHASYLPEAIAATGSEECSSL